MCNIFRKKKINFVFILVDDLGWKDTGCYGSSFYETPNIDKLAGAGIRFTNAYAASPVCSPTRASIMTGKYPARLKITDWIGGGDLKGKLLPAACLPFLPREETTFAEAFKQAGYSTYLTDRLTDEAVKFIDSHRDGAFFLMLSHYAVHTPIQAKEDLKTKYQKKAEKIKPGSSEEFARERDSFTKLVQNHSAYAGMVESVDESVGRILDKLKQLGIEDHTAIIFMSDNGGLSTLKNKKWAPTANVPLRAGKGWLYEGGIREPMIVKLPGVLDPGEICRVPVMSTDFYPTMLELANIPPKPEQHKDGVSLVPLLKQREAFQQRDLFWHYPHYHGSGSRPCSAIRSGDYKLIEWFEDDSIELYDLKQDPGEKNNLAEKMADKANELKIKLRDWRIETGALMPRPNPDWSGE
ncbi:hypothetical protein B6I21_09330 [candidate division KSB1 bacterium 4572_119]|nr:MAG: hypothetical protein B6I21_09330 [candidate division KSB1 bacterium 4572_119]